MNKPVILIFGTFNPITNAHIEMGLEAKKLIPKADVIYVPSNLDFMKDWKDIDTENGYHLTDDERFELVQKAAGVYGMSAVDYDIRKEKTDGRTYHAVQVIREELGYDEVYLCMGFDKLTELKAWFQAEALFSECRVLIFDRDHQSIDDLEDEFIQRHRDNFIHIEVEVTQVSSTRIRSAIRKQKLDSVRDFIPEVVYKRFKEAEKMKNILIVVDMQNDFVDAALGTKEAEAIIPAVVKKIENWDGPVYVTYDTHTEEYMNTREGRFLPVPHCIQGTEGYELNPRVQAAVNGKENVHIIRKETFGSYDLPKLIEEEYGKDISIELIGLCTDICVVSNALLLKACFVESEISVDAACCAGVTPEKHEAALEVMRSCQICVR